MSEEERKQKIVELKKTISEVPKGLVELIKHEKKIQDQRAKELVKEITEDHKKLILAYVRYMKIERKVLEMAESNPEIKKDDALAKEYMDALVELSRLIENSPVYDNTSLLSEDAIKRAQLVLSLKTLEGFEEWDYYFKEYLEQTGLYFCFGYRCKRCGHVWLPRHFNPLGDNDNILHKKPPKSCARCKSKFWNLAPKRKTKNVIVNNEGVLKHNMLTKTQILTMCKNIDRVLPQLRKILLEWIEEADKEKEQQQVQEPRPIIMVTNRKKKKRTS